MYNLLFALHLEVFVIPCFTCCYECNDVLSIVVEKLFICSSFRFKKDDLVNESKALFRI